METIEFSLRGLIHESVEVLADLANLRAANVVRQLDPLLPDLLIGDPLRLKMVLIRLLETALNLADHRPVRLSVFATSQRDRELDLTFEACSPGAHLDEAAVQRLLGREADSADQSEPEEAVDRGLALASRIAQLLGGEIGAQSEAGPSATFWFRVPIERASDPRPPQTPQLTGPPSLHAADHASVRILMAEDNVINQRVGKLILQRAGFGVDLVGDGSEAIEAHGGHPYHLILMDCQMPMVDGLEATRQIRAMAVPQPVIIAVTANALVGERERCIEAGMNDYLSKPFHAEQLVAIVEKWIGAAASPSLGPKCG